MVAEHLGTDHHRLVIRPKDIASTLPLTVWRVEAPTCKTSNAAYIRLYELAARSSKVILTGEGADEALGGYPNIRMMKVLAFCRRHPNLPAARKLMDRLLPPGSSLRVMYYEPKELEPADDAEVRARFGCLPADLQRFRSLSALKSRLFSEECRQALRGYSAEGDFAETLVNPALVRGRDPIQQAQYFEYLLKLPNYLLVNPGDRAAMTHSVENRCPFLDHRFVETCMRLPLTMRVRALEEKYVLKKAFAADLPPAITKRKKRPFTTFYVSSIFKKDRPEYLDEVLSETRGPERRALRRRRGRADEAPDRRPLDERRGAGQARDPVLPRRDGAALASAVHQPLRPRRAIGMTKAYWEAFWRRVPETSAVEASGWLSDGPRRAVVDAVDEGFLRAPARILDVGCGLGGSAAWLAERGFDVTAIDLSEEALARARPRSARVRWLVADCTSREGLPAPDVRAPFDAVVDCGTLHQLGEPEQRAYVDNLRAWTAPGARLLLLMRYGAPLFASVTRAMLVNRVGVLFDDGFAQLALADVDMAEAAGAPRPGSRVPAPPDRRPARPARPERRRREEELVTRLGPLLVESAARHPTRAALVGRDRTLAYGELVEESARVGERLRRSGVTRGRFVLLAAGNSVDWLVTFLAALRLEALVGVLDPAVLPAHRARIELNLAAAAVLTDGGLGLSSRGASGDEATSRTEAIVAAGADLLIFTSGSTGEPKGVLVAEDNVIANIAWNVDAFELTDASVTCNFMPLSAFLNLSYVVACLAVGTTVLVERNLGDLQGMLARMNDAGLTHLNTVPVALRTIVERGDLERSPLRSVRCVRVGAGLLPFDLALRTLERFGDARVVATYGMTEIGLVASRCWSREDARPEDVGTYGAVAAGKELLFAEDRGEEGDGREIELVSPYLHRGYYHAGEARLELRAGPYATGDLGERTASGALRIVARRKQIAKVAGVLVDLEDLSRIGRSCPASTTASPSRSSTRSSERRSTSSSPSPRGRTPTRPRSRGR